MLGNVSTAWITSLDDIKGCYPSFSMNNTNFVSSLAPKLTFEYYIQIILRDDYGNAINSSKFDFKDEIRILPKEDSIKH